MKTSYLLIFAFLFINFDSIAQKIEAQKISNKSILTGKIIDINGLPLIGAQICVKEIAVQTTTDFDGQFSLELEGEAIINISFIDFEPIELLVKPQTNIIILLEENNSSEVETHVSRKEMRKIRRAQNKQTNIGIDGNSVETLFYFLKAIAK
jgi:hypothetical protein